MPQLVKEITQGQSKSKAAGGGQNAPDSGSAARVFRVILSQPGETFDPVETCGVSIGSQHPSDSDYLCRDYNVAYEGESRTVVAVTFNYALVQDSNGNQDQPPDVRPANWSLSSTLMERPCTMWRRLDRLINIWGPWQLPTNPVGDIYDGVTTMEPVVTITITQYCVSDPTSSAMYVGTINSEEIALGSLEMQPHTVMLRSVQSVPTVETFGDVTYRGWTATWEFAYRRNVTRCHQPDTILDGRQKEDAGEEMEIGWDIAVPQSGMNVRAWAGVQAAVDGDGRNTTFVDVYGQPLKHGDAPDPNSEDPVRREGRFYGRIVRPLSVPSDVANLSRQRAMVRVFSYENGGSSQTPSAMPIALNEDGTPRNTEPFQDGSRYYPIVWRYQVYQELNFTQTLGLRLY